MNNQASLLIKSELIDCLLQRKEYDIIISELPFLGCTRLADLVAVSQNMTIAFEIKSEKDSLQYLTEQLEDYRQVFNLVYIVIAEKFYQNIQIKKLPKSIGIIRVSLKGKLSLKRKAIIRKNLNKHALLSLLWKKDMQKLTNLSKKQDLNQLRSSIIKNCSISKIQYEAIQALLNRYKESYKMFLQDREQYTSLEDLRTITGLKKNPVV